MTYLIDSDILIDALNGRSEAAAILEALAAEGLYVSIISLGEIFDGAVGAREPERHLAIAERFLASYSVLQLSRETMLRFAQLRVALRRSGQLIPHFDLLIAASALEYGLVLITRDRRHYERISGLTLYES